MYSADLLRHARRIIFVQRNEFEFMTITALRESVEVGWWSVGSRSPLRSHRIDKSAQDLGLFDGRAWNLTILAGWIERHCPVCWRPLTSKRQCYDTLACKQKAYRERKKMAQKILQRTIYHVTNAKTGEKIDGVMVMVPEHDVHARRAILAYAESLDFENPQEAQDLREWVSYLNLTFPIRMTVTEQSDALPEWLVKQSRTET
jgi:hypothetical protein